MGAEIKTDALFYLTGASALFTYMLIRLVAIKRISTYEPESRWDFFFRNLKLLRITTYLAAIASVVLFFCIPLKLQITLLVPGLISVLYGVPLGKKFRLRDIGIIKIFLISFVWSYIASILPAVNADITIDFSIILLFLANYCFVFAITLPFDIKDLKIDKISNVKTIPVYIGEENTYNLSALLLFIAAGLHVYLQREIFSNDVDYTVPLSISILITMLVVWITRKKRNNSLIYFGLLDGMLIVQFLLCFLYRMNNI